jgi:hypothetical protein
LQPAREDAIVAKTRSMNKKPSDFSEKGAGFSVEKGMGFSPYIPLSEKVRALASEGFLSRAILRAAPLLLLFLFAAPRLQAQAAAPRPPSGPIAIVLIDNKNPDAAAKVIGTLEVSQGKAIIGASGTITSGSQTTEVILPHRGLLRVCASTAVKLAADTGAPAGETPGLMMAMDRGAIELSLAASLARNRNADFLLTPDFRILIGGPGAAEVKVRLGQHGDTCVDNSQIPGPDAPYVLVSSVFDGGDYRVQSGQRVMFEHGSLREVVDNEKEPCGCPPPAPQGNEFPLAQSEGLVPLAKPAPGVLPPSPVLPQTALVYKSSDHAAQPASEAAPASGAAATPTAPPAARPTAKKKGGFLGGIKRFFRRLFGAE